MDQPIKPVALVIVDRGGTVHAVRAGDVTCQQVHRAPRRLPVTGLQCLVYKLPGCGVCFPMPHEYARFVGGRSS